MDEAVAKKLPAVPEPSLGWLRMYVDEVGNESLESSIHEDHRYLSLTGVVMSHHHILTKVQPELDEIKARYFGHSTDNIINLHRSDLLSRKRPFHVLREPGKEEAFHADFLGFLQRTDFFSITVTIDKREQMRRYKVWRADPYHYCMQALMERFAMHLQSIGMYGDVLAERRGLSRDDRLAGSYKRTMTRGTSAMSSIKLKRYLARNLLFSRKTDNRAGLQIVDMIANPTLRYMLRQKDPAISFGKPMNERIAELVIKSKVRRRSDGNPDGWGLKWLP